MPAVPQAGQLARAEPPAPRSAGRSGTAGLRRAAAPRAPGRTQPAGASWAGRVPQRDAGAHRAVAAPLPSIEAQGVGTGTGRPSGRAAPWDRQQAQPTTGAIAAPPGRPPPSPSQRTYGAAVADRPGAARVPAARRVRRRCPRYPSAFLAPWPDLPTTHTQLPAAPHGPHSRHVTARRTGARQRCAVGPRHRLATPAASTQHPRSLGAVTPTHTPRRATTPAACQPAAQLSALDAANAGEPRRQIPRRLSTLTGRSAVRR